MINNEITFAWITLKAERWTEALLKAAESVFEDKRLLGSDLNIFFFKYINSSIMGCKSGSGSDDSKS